MFLGNSGNEKLTGIDLQHALFGVTLEGKLHLAPISDTIENCLDIATGIYTTLPFYGSDKRYRYRNLGDRIRYFPSSQYAEIGSLM